jgi:tRNA nucleotidyltransferase/poly(A) polymerase
MSADAQGQPQTDPAAARRAAVDVVRALVSAGHEAYFAGGCVRDKLMGHEPYDYDIATDARPEHVKAIFPKMHSVGESFGVMLVREAGHVIQVATFRTDGVYSDGRRPDEITFSDARHDAQRRDFTINGLFENPLTDEIIDHVGGRDDLASRVIRAIGDADARLREDRLRMLRAVRFAARFAFAIEESTADAIRRSSGELRGVSRERIGQEVRRMFTNVNRAVAAWEMQYLGLDTAVLDEPSMMTAPTRVGHLPEVATYPTALAAWLIDRHAQRESEWIEAAGRWATALMLSNEERFGLMRALEISSTFLSDWTSLGVAAQKRLASSPHFNDALALVQATDRQMFVDRRRHVYDLAQTGLNPDPLLDGEDLIRMGLKPGPLFSRVLTAVYDAQLEGSVTDHEQAVAMARMVAQAES